MPPLSTTTETELDQLARKLRAAEDRYAELVDHIDAIVWRADPHTFQFTFVSRVGLSLLGYSIEEWQAPGFWPSIIHPDDISVVDECRIAVDSGVDHVLTYRLRTAGGAYRAFRDHVHLGVGDLFGIMVDVTELMEAEASAWENEAKYRRLIEEAPDGIGVHVAGRFVLANAALAAILGAENSLELVGEPVLRFIHPDYVQRIAERQAALGRGESVAVMPQKLIRVDGTVVDVEVSALPVPFGRATAVQVIVRDISDRIAAAERIRETESRLQILAAASNDALWEWSYDHCMTWMNDAYAKLFGTTDLASLTLESWLDKVHPEDRERVHKGLDQALERRVPMWTEEYRFRNPQGEWLRILARCQLRFNAEGVPVRLIGGMMDVTELRAGEERRRELERQLDQAKRLSSLGRLAASVAHEFNNVLMGIQPFAEVLTRPGQSREKIETAGGYIAQSIERGRNIALQILRFASPQPPELATVGVRDWLEDVAAEARAVSGLLCSVLLKSGSNASLQADRRQLTQVLMNLVINARDAMPGGGCITISATDEQEAGRDEVHFVISDEGSGIPPHLLRNVFDPLFTTKRNGTGLGLSIAYQIITSHGGRMFAASSPAGGAAIHVLLPAVPAGSEQAAAAARPAASPARSVLLVEDDEAVAAGLVMLFEQEGFLVNRLPDGSRLLETYDRVRPDVIVLDMNLPGAGGAEVYAQLRARFGPVCVVFSTGHFDPSDVENEPNVRLLMKPYTFDALTGTIEELLASCGRTED
ncbi:MAG: sensory box histidine kinase/response regulator [Acidobacteria bacterium]|nr:sensory box histidine kinase/response regulator [Acidobacteriota bacterium]